LDNGGSGVPDIYGPIIDKYLRWIKNPDPDLVDRVIALDHFLQGKKPFLDYTSPEDFLKDLGLRKFQKNFVRNVHLMATYFTPYQAGL
jgi:hypothetical protein